MQNYCVEIANNIEAESPEDAVRQMVAWVAKGAPQGYFYVTPDFGPTVTVEGE